MTSPRQRKKKLTILKLRKKREQQSLKNNIVEEKQPEIKKQEPAKAVEVAAPPVVESETKPKKTKNALVETKPQEQVVEQSKVEVKTTTKE